MQKIYCRSIRPDGYGEGVTLDAFDQNDDPFAQSYNAQLKKYLKNAEPDPRLIHPDLAKVGWVGEYRQQKQVYETGVGKWEDCSEALYLAMLRQSLNFTRIVLVPVERKEEEKEVVSKTPEFGGIEPEDYGSPEYAADTYAMGEFNSHHFPQQYMIARNGYLAGLKAKPTPVTDEAVDVNDPFIKKHLDIIWRKLREAKIDGHIKPMFGSLEAASIEHFLKTGSVNGSFHMRLMEMMDGFRTRVEIDPQAASRPSDAVDFVNYLLLDGHIQMVEQAARYTPEQLYQLFKQQTTKP